MPCFAFLWLLVFESSILRVSRHVYEACSRALSFGISLLLPNPSIVVSLSSLVCEAKVFPNNLAVFRWFEVILLQASQPSLSSHTKHSTKELHAKSVPSFTYRRAFPRIRSISSSFSTFCLQFSGGPYPALLFQETKSPRGPTQCPHSGFSIRKKKKKKDYICWVVSDNCHIRP